MDYTNELVATIINKMDKEDLKIDVKLRDVLYSCLYKYDISLKETTPTKIDIHEKIELYLSMRKAEGMSPKSLKNYGSVLRDFARLVDKKADDINARDIREYLHKFCEGNKKTTINNKQTTIKSFFTWLYDEEYIENNPTLKVKKIKTTKKLVNALKVDELEKIRMACDNIRDRAIIELFYATGCRLSEVVDMNISDVNFSNNSIRIVGKGDIEDYAYFNDKAKVYLMKYLETRTDNDEALFVTKKKPHHRIGARGIQYVIEGVAKKEGIRTSPHKIRHSTATHGKAIGATIYEIQQKLRHSSILTSMIYLEKDTNEAQYNNAKYFSH